MFRLTVVLLLLSLMLPLAMGQEDANAIPSIESAIRSKNYDQALLMARSALHQSPADFRVWTLQGIVLSLEGDSPGALAAFRKALALSPGYPAALKGEAQLLYQTGDKRAPAVLETIVKADPGDRTAQEMLALIEAKQGHCAGAVEHFRLSKDALGSHSNSLERYGSCLVRLKRMEQAIPVFEQLVALLPDRPYARYDLALIQTMANRDREAVQTLEPLVAANTADPDILSLASEADEAIGDTPHAVSLLRQAIVSSPENEDYYARFAALCLDHDSFQVGIDMLNAGLQRLPNTPSLYILRGLLYSELAQYDRAEADFETAERLDPAQGLSSYALGLAEIQSGHPGEALATVRAQIKDHANDPSLHYLLAKILMDQGPSPGSPQFKEAMSSTLTAVRLKPGLAPARDLLASLYIRSGQNSLAIEQCRRVLETDPSNQAAYYHLIMASRDSRNKAEIQQMVKRFTALQQEARKEENGKKRYKLIEQEQPVRNE